MYNVRRRVIQQGGKEPQQSKIQRGGAKEPQPPVLIVLLGSAAIGLAGEKSKKNMTINGDATALTSSNLQTEMITHQVVMALARDSEILARPLAGTTGRAGRGEFLPNLVVEPDPRQRAIESSRPGNTLVPSPPAHSGTWASGGCALWLP